MARKSISPSNSAEELETLRKRITELESALAAEKQNAIDANNAAERYLLAIKNAPDVLLALDCDGKIIFSNEVPPGKTPESMVGKSIFDFISTADHREKLSNALQHVLKTEKTASYEHQDADGVWHATRVSPIKKDGKVVAVSVVGTNIQNYKHLQAEYTRVLDAERRQRELAEALRDAGTAFSSTLDLDTIINTLLTQIARVVPYDAANVMVVENNIARITQARGYDSFGKTSLGEIQGLTFNILETANLRTMYETMQPLIIPDTGCDPNWIHIRPKTAIRSWAGAPIIVQGEVVAFFSLDKAEANFYRQDDAVRLAAFAGQAAVAIKNARLFEEVRAALAKTQALHIVGQSLIKKIELDYVLQTGVDILAQTLPAHTVILSDKDLEEEDIAYFVKGGQGAHEIDDISYDTLQKGLTGWVLQEQTSLLSHQRLATLLKEQPTAPVPDEQPSNVVVVPLRYQNKMLGTVTAINREIDPPYTPDDVELMEAMANQAAIAIQNAALFEESRRQARLVQQILDSVSQGIILLDKDCRVKLANPTAEQQLPALSNSPLSEPLSRLGNETLTTFIETPGIWRELSAIDGSESVFSATVHPIQAATGIEGWVLVFRDVTTEHAMQKRIYQQERLAALGQMASGIAHDFNNILTSIIGFADLISRQPGIPPASQTLLTNIVSQGQKGAQLIGQILDFSRQSVSRKKPIGIASFLSDTIKLLRRLIPENIAIVEEIDDSLASAVINIDAAQIQQVFTNLAINARDAMPVGGTLAFKLSPLVLSPDDTPPFPSMPAGHWLHLAITDTGEGIDENLLQHIFEPFFTTKDVGKGTGLGLSQAYGIMKQHNGYITANSTVGEGTTLNLYFPLDETDMTAQISPAEREILPLGHGETILLVEDELAVLSVGKAMLKHLGYSVLTAKDGYEALAEFDKFQQEIALVLTDITMPRLGGIALAKQLKERDPNLRILALSGYPLESGAKKKLSEGFVGWLQKPLNIKQLATAIAEALA